jgi:hypothetical protein
MKPVMLNLAPIFLVLASQNWPSMAHIALQREMRRVVSTNVDLIAVFRRDLEELTV